MIHGSELLRVLPSQHYGTGSWPEEKGRIARLILKLRPAPSRPTLGMGAQAIRKVFDLLSDPAACWRG
ncbi:MAG: hypothetical protein J0M04_06620 [Verrucomicrobia bacterium]|nr:hypothetical protein [Verrucomicrobiota bacterium]